MSPSLLQPLAQPLAAGNERLGEAQAARLQLHSHLRKAHFALVLRRTGGLQMAVPGEDRQRPDQARPNFALDPRAVDQGFGLIESEDRFALFEDQLDLPAD